MENKDIQKTQKCKKSSKKNVKIKQKSKKLCEKSKYFEFYDDIKMGSTKNVDW